MATASGLRRRARDRPAIVTGVLSVVGYALVGGAFAGVLPFPAVSRAVVIWLGDAIAAVNAMALLAILVGYRAIRRGNVGRHRAAMLAAFTLIAVFLAMYLLKVGGGFEKAILVEGPVYWAYLAMLAVHILLSAVAVPVVLHAVVLGLSHPPAELGDTVHPRVGRVAVVAWSFSLALGLVTYVMLNHLYGWEPLAMVAGFA